ncbi:ABC transporter ATP-binding protein [Phytohabitans kaempferiae]|uniref:ABC transporter ATP-binding protein n=1 Tax=Phytohabitans kaempferiae TaxID=1620943 RepID=A0ABV6LZG1_9ACTN
MAGVGDAQLRDGAALLRVTDLEVDYPTKEGVVRAVSGVSFDVLRGETVGLVGESGCGKSTTGRAILRLPAPSRGSVHFDGVEVTALSFERMRELRGRLQMIFQDPISSLNPRRRVRDIVAEGLVIRGGGGRAEVAERVAKALDDVGLDPATAGSRRPSEFSGGQCQRICIARVLVLEPELIVCDEPVSALDVSVQAQILNLLASVKASYGLSLLFISHDLSVVRHICDRVVVMYLGRVCEVGPTERVFQRPAHPYTRLLMESVPGAAADRPPGDRAKAELPSVLAPPSGCYFRTRCPLAVDRCATETPVTREVAPGQYVACHLAEA